MNILFLNVKNPYVDSNNPPLGLAYISAYLKQNTNDNIKAVDFCVDKMEFDDFSKEYLFDYKPDIIGISIVTPTFIYAVEIAKKIKEVFDVHISVGGTHPSAVPEETAKEECFDSVIIGEGEEVFLKLRNIIEKGQSYDKILYGTRIKDINSLPLPDRSIFPMDKYNFSIDDIPGTSLITSRGCPFHCVFCNTSVFGKRVMRRSPEKIVEEIEHLIENYGFHSFYFLDDIFTINKKATHKFCDIINEKNINIVWKCMSRVDTIDEELIIKMKKTGCKELVFGVESGNEEVLEKTKKGITKQQAIFAIGLAKKHDLKTKTFFMIGFPWDTEETIIETINFAIELDADFSQFAVVAPFPKTEIVEILNEMNINVSTDWQDYLLKGDEINYAFDHPNISNEDLKKYIEVAYEHFDKKEKIM